MKAKIPKVSVITLTYKKFDNLNNTISSVLAQDYENIEYIICDDGSENFPYNQVQELIVKTAKKYISTKILQNPVNLGTVKSINRAYKDATGKYILNLSCGDVFFTDNTVSQIVKRFEDTRANVLVTSRLFYEKDFKPIYFLPHYEEREVLKELDTPLKQYKAFILSRFYDMASGSAMYFRNTTIKKFNYFDERYRLWEDGPFLAKYLWNDKLEMAYDIVSIWYEKGGVSTNKNSPAKRMLIKDSALFALGEKLDHLDCFSKNEKRIIRNNNKRYMVSNKTQLWLLCLKYCPQIISNLMYMRKRNIYAQNDMFHINELLNNNKEHILPQRLRCEF